MNSQRLHNVLYELNDMISRGSIPSLLKTFQNTFNQSISQPNTQTSEQFSSARDTLWNELEGSPSNSFPPSQARIITTIGGNPYLGNGLSSALTAIIDENAATPGQAVSGIQEHIKKANEFYAAVKAAHEALEKLNIEYDFTGKEEYEVGVLLPSKLFDNNIDELGTEFHTLNQHMKTFGELAGDDTSSPTVRSISNGSLELFLNALPAVAECIAEAIEYVVIMYLSILQIRKHRKELKDEKVPDKALKPLVEHEKQRVSEEINQIVKKLFKKYRKKKEKLRDEELKGHLLNAVTYLAKRIDQGADFEVSPPSQFDEIDEEATENKKKKVQAQQEAARQLQAKGQSINQLPERTQQALALPDPKKISKDKDEPQQ